MYMSLLNYLIICTFVKHYATGDRNQSGCKESTAILQLVVKRSQIDLDFVIAVLTLRGNISCNIF